MTLLKLKRNINKRIKESGKLDQEEALKLKNLNTEVDKEVMNERLSDEFLKLRKLLQSLEGVNVPYYKVPSFLKSKDFSLRILSPVYDTVEEDGNEKKLAFEYRITSGLCNFSEYSLQFALYGPESDDCRRELLNRKKELFKFLRKANRTKWWDNVKTSSMFLTLLGAITGIVGEKLLGFIIGILKNDQLEIIIHVIK